MKKTFVQIFTVAVLLAGTAHAADIVKTDKGEIEVEVLANGLEHPWGMAFLPDGKLLITERDGFLRLYDDGNVSKPIRGVPRVAARGQGGLLDVAIDPAFQENRKIYLTYSEPGGGIGTAAASARLNGAGDRLSKVEVIYRQSKKTGAGRHFGSRLAFSPDGTLFITNGDRGERDRAQDPFDHAGSLIRINSDGSIPADNPFADGKQALPEIYSIGHRNAQGADIHPETGEIWTVEHGARGGDEINKPEAGKNYGWPIISYGTHYSGFKIGEGQSKTGLEQPLHYWDPSIAPSGLEFYTGDLIPNWKGDLFVGALKFQTLVRLELEGDKIVGEERIFDGDYGRIRDVETGPDGALYLLTDADDGLLLRLTAK